MRQLPFLLCCMLLAYGLFRPEPPPELFDDSDKLMHLFAFGLLGLAGRLAFPRSSPLLLFGAFLVTALLLECLQHWIQPLRQFSLEDAFANMLGIALAMLVWQGYLWLARRLRGKPPLL